MSAALIIYLADIAQGVGIFLFFIMIVSLLATVIALAFWKETYGETDKEDHEKSKWFLRRSFAVFLLASMLGIMIPSKSTIYLIAGAKISQDIITAPETKEIGNKLLKVINSKLDEQLKEKTK